MDKPSTFDPLLLRDLLNSFERGAATSPSFLCSSNSFHFPIRKREQKKRFYCVNVTLRDAHCFVVERQLQQVKVIKRERMLLFNLSGAVGYLNGIPVRAAQRHSGIKCP